MTETLAEDKKMNNFERIDRILSFYSKAVPVFASYKILEASLDLQRNYLGKVISVDEEEVMWSKLHDRGSDLITEVINDLKGFYVKAGQMISTRVDIFPLQYTTKLRPMQDSLDPVPTEIIKDIVRSELLDNAPLSDLFLEFDEIPIGSASIAQVHRGKLLDGAQYGFPLLGVGKQYVLLITLTNACVTVR